MAGAGEGVAVSCEMRGGDTHRMVVHVLRAAGWAHGCLSLPRMGLAGRGWQEPVPRPSPVPPSQAEAAEHGGGGGPAAPEGAVHLRKCCDGHGAGVRAGAAARRCPQGMAFPLQAPRASRGWGGVTPHLFPGGTARGGRQAAAQEIGVRGGGECGGGRAQCWSLLPSQRCPQLDGDPAGGCMGGGPAAPHHRGGGSQPPLSPQEAAAIIAQRPDNPRDFFKQQERVASGSSDAISPGSHRTGEVLGGWLRARGGGARRNQGVCGLQSR